MSNDKLTIKRLRNTVYLYGLGITFLPQHLFCKVKCHEGLKARNL